MFFILYLVMFSGMIPVTLQSYDEKSRWSEYSQALPYTPAQLVSVKYLDGLLAFGVTIVLFTVTQVIIATKTGVFDMGQYLSKLAVFWSLFTVCTSITLPLIFRYGVEKGRIGYYVALAVVCAFVAASGIIFQDSPIQLPTLPLAGLVMVSIAVYIVLWMFSIKMIKKKEQ